MKIKTSEFILSSVEVNKCPPEDKPEYAFIGRSNVGKSSLLNTLLNRKNLARVSSTPGKTQTINHFLINNSWYLVDLPGYGWAKVSKGEKKLFSKFSREYLLKRKNLVTTFILIDIRHEPQKVDLEFLEWIGTNQLPFVIVFTKADKVTGVSKKKALIAGYEKELLKYWEELPPIYTTSAFKKTGVEDVLAYIKEGNVIFNESK